jgi:hypothetical protein
VTAARDALIAECAREEENCRYTAATFFIWLRILKGTRATLWVLGAVGSIVSAGSIIGGDQGVPIIMAGLALAGVLMPGLVKALRLDSTIKAYAASAGAFKNLEGEFRRLAKVWSHKPFPEFEAEARPAFKAIAAARKPSLTPPEFCFRLARAKIKRGDYTHDSDTQGEGAPSAPARMP